METVYLSKNQQLKPSWSLPVQLKMIVYVTTIWLSGPLEEELRFPAKKLKAFWFSPPNNIHSSAGTGVYGPLPRIFMSELLVDQMSPETQKIIRKYTESSGNEESHAALASALGSLTWNKPTYSEFQLLARQLAFYTDQQALKKYATDAMNESQIYDFLASLNTLQCRRMDFVELCAAALSVYQLEALDIYIYIDTHT